MNITPSIINMIFDEMNPTLKNREVKKGIKGGK
jgi:hypothetical protein